MYRNKFAIKEIIDFAWNLNDYLNLKLKKGKSVVLKEDQFNEEMNFSRFEFFDSKANFNYCLLSNRHKWGFSYSGRVKY